MELLIYKIIFIIGCLSIFLFVVFLVFVLIPVKRLSPDFKKYENLDIDNLIIDGIGGIHIKDIQQFLNQPQVQEQLKAAEEYYKEYEE
jgi:hypothetical protein